MIWPVEIASDMSALPAAILDYLQKERNLHVRRLRESSKNQGDFFIGSLRLGHLAKRRHRLADWIVGAVHATLCRKDDTANYEDGDDVQEAARESRRSRSRVFLVRAAARSNSARASLTRPSLRSRSPRTLGSKW